MKLSIRNLSLAGALCLVCAAPLAATLHDADGSDAADVAALKTQVAALQQQVNQLKADTDKSFFQDRFRLTAIEAGEKQGANPQAINDKINALQTYAQDTHKQVDAVRGIEDSLKSSLNDLDARFKAHSHSYEVPNLGWGGDPLKITKGPDIKKVTSTPR